MADTDWEKGQITPPANEPTDWDAGEIKAPPENGAFARGFKTSMRQIPQTIGGAIGLAGDAMGSDGVRDYGMGIYERQSEKIKELSSDDDSFSNVLEGKGDLGEFAKYGTGYVAGQALSALGTGGVGGFVGKKLVQKGIAKEVGEEAAKQAMTRGAKIGAGTGLAAGNFIQEAGAIYPEAVHQAEQDGRTLDGGDLARVAGSALVAAGVDTAADALMFRGITNGVSSRAGFAGRAARAIPGGMAREGVTEGIQTGIERFGAQQDFGSEEAIRDYVDSAALGALGGGLGGTASAITQRKQPEIPQAPVQDPVQPAEPAPAQAAEDPMQEIRRNWVLRQRELAAQENGEILPPQTTPPDGAAILAQQQAEQAKLAQEQQAASRAVESPDDEIYQSIGVTTPSQQMGLNPAAGTMSHAAALAVDTGAHGVMQQAAAQQAAAQEGDAKQKGSQTQQALSLGDAANLSTETANVNQETGEVLGPDRVQQLEERLSFIGQQARSNGWDQRLIAARTEAEAELAQLKPPPANLQEGIQQVRAQKSSGDTQAVTTEPVADIKAIAAKQLPQMTDAELQQVAGYYAPDHKRTPKIQKEMAKRGISPTTTETTNAQQANQAQQASPQRTQTPGAPAAPSPSQEGVAPQAPSSLEEVGSRWDSMSKADRQAIADRTDLKGVLRRNVSGGEWKNFGVGVKSKLQEAMGYAKKPVVDAQTPRVDAQNPVIDAQNTVPDAQNPVSDAPSSLIDAAAHEAATSHTNDRPEPTEAQKEAGNYAKGHVRVQGLDISIENPRGSERKGTSKAGVPWSHAMSDHYGYIKRTKGADGEQVDVYVGADDAAPTVFVVDQIDQDTGAFDEHKAMIGFRSEADAVNAYSSNFDAGWKVGKVRAMPMAEFKQWIAEGDTTKPAAGEQSSPNREQDQAARAEVEVVREQKAPNRERSKKEKRAAEDQAVADYFTPGNIVSSYDGHDRVIDYTAGENGAWTVRVRAVQKEGDSWVDVPNARERTHTTTPDARALKAGPISRAKVEAPKEYKPAEAASDADRFAGNTLFTADKVAAARARMKKKLGTLNSGIDPELLVDGMTVAGAYIESGVRNFGQYAKAMIEDMGDGVKPYLLSFWEGARNFPGLDTKGMTSADESARQHAALMTPADSQTEAVGTIDDKPKTRSKKTGAKGDQVLTQDWGTPHIDGYGDADRESGNDTKDAFLKETRSYLNAVSDALRSAGFEPHEDRKGKPEKPVSVNEGGMAGSGDVTLTMRNQDTGNNIFIHIGDTALRGVVPTSPSGIAIMYRVGTGQDRYATRGGNRWAPVDLSAKDLAALISSEVNRNANALPTKQLPSTTQGSGATDAALGNRDSKPLDDGLAGSRDSTDSVRSVPGSTQEPGGKGADRVQRAGEQPSGTPRNSGDLRTEQRSADTVAKESDPATAEVSPKPELDDHTLDADDIGKGGLTKKYRDNIAAIRILKAMGAENRKATPEERKQISRYVGWGSLKGVFDPDNKQWTAEHAELKELLTDAEYKAARASILNAYYTSPDVVGAIYQALGRLGFTQGRTLEPSVGVGNFFGLMPADMRKKSQLHGVELDPLTSQIAAALYPSAKIAQTTGFQDYDVPGEYFDLAIGNPPFGNEPIVDSARSAYSGLSIHNYFFAKSIDKLRPGGLLSMVVSHNFMDARNDTARRWIADRANLVGAVRLPNTAFKANAGTEVVTDILVFQKKTESERANGLGDDSWVKVGEQSLDDPKTGESVKHRVSSYFLNNPQNVLGKPTAAGSMYRSDEYTVEPNGKLPDQLKGWVNTLPEGIYQPIERTIEPEAADISIPDGVKVGSFFLNDKGEIQVRGDDVMGNRTATPWIAPNSKASQRMAGMIGLRDALRSQMRFERSQDASEDEIETSRKALNDLYDKFQKDHGYLNDPTNRRLFIDDTESALVLALEFDYDKGVSKLVADREGIDARPARAAKADILKRRVLFPPGDSIKVNNAQDALLASLNYKGSLDLPYMASLYDKPESEIITELGDVIFSDPIKGYVTADEYLSGDVKTKLAEAESIAKTDPVYRRNVEALKKVIPADKRPSEIHASLGAAFVPVEHYQQFAKEITGADAKLTYIKATGQWIVNWTSNENAALNTGKWGTSKMPATAIFAKTLAGQGVVVSQTIKGADGSTTTVVLEKETAAAREKQEAIKAEWQRWLWVDGERADSVAEIYNEKLNRIVPRRYDGSHLTFPGMSPAIKLLAHQKNAVWRGLQSRQMLLDHVVGAGKTFEIIALFMEMRRLGIARKPFIAVPNHLTLQWRSEFSRLYPAANVLAATPDDFTKGNREKFFSKIVTGDWDAVIVGHSSLKRIGLPAETEKAVVQEQIDEISEAIEATKRARGDRNIIRDMENIRARLDARMKAKLQAIGERDKVLTFDELGIDALAVDELHEFKNLTYNSTMDRSPGMGNPAGSDKAFDLFVKIQWLFNTFGDQAPITGATGTPVSNSLVEMFNMQRYMQYPALKREGLNVFDAWAKQFGSVESVYEVSPSGTGYRQSSRFSKFKNLSALLGQYRSFADTITLDDLKAQEEAAGKRFPVPKLVGGKPTNVVAERSPRVANFMGIPQLDIQDGKPKFVFNPATEEGVVRQDNETWVAEIKSQVDGADLVTRVGTAKTEEDARLLLVEAALSPKIDIDKNSILGQFSRLRELTKATKGKVNALSLTGAANKAGLDYRLIDANAPDFAGSKINKAVDRMLGIYKKWSADKGTQLVFCDLSVPNSARSGFSAKERRVYVKVDGQVTHKRGTMHTVEGYEELPFFVVKEGGKEKSFAVYDAGSGLRLKVGIPQKGMAVDWAAKTLADDNARQRWVDARTQEGDLEADAIDDYNNANEIDTEESESISLADVAGVSATQKFSVYDDIRQKLIAKGVPEREIAFIHDYGTPAAKDKIFKAVNKGDVRFLLGSTLKMGAGTNVQERLVAVHHIDAPWRPSDLEQRDGRIIRRGNLLYERDPDGFEIETIRYATSQTYDTRRWQILEHKARGIEALRKNDGSLNELDDIDGEAANASDMKAAASGDPLILEETQLRSEVRRLESLQASHADEKASLTRRARDNERFATEYAPRELAHLEELQAAIAKHPVKKDAFAGLKVDKKTYSERDEAIKGIKSAIDSVLGMMNGKATSTFTYRGVEFTLDGNAAHAVLESPLGQMDSFGAVHGGEQISAAGFLTRFANFVNRVPAHITDLKAKAVEAEKSATQLREQASKPFDKADELTAARDAHKRVQRRLIAKGPDIPPVQKPMLEQAMNEQRAALREKGFGEALDEFMGNADRAKFSFAGKKAQGADSYALREAVSRFNNGEDPDAIRQDTGWHKGLDGKWRYEISDDQAIVVPSGSTFGDIRFAAQLGASEGAQVKVGDVLDHPQLFAAYPELAEINLEEMPQGVVAQARMQRRPTGPVIMVKGSMPRAKVASAILHELQHAIQAKEGFAVGGSRKNLVSDLDPTGAKTYKRLAGEVEARNTQARAMFTDAQRRIVPPQMTADVDPADVLVSFNGRDVVGARTPENFNSSNPYPITEDRLIRAFEVQHPELLAGVKKMLARGRQGAKGGAVVIKSSDPTEIAKAFSQKTGRPFDESVQLFSDAQTINGFYDPKSGLVFLVGPNLDPVTAVGVLLHEVTHSQQRASVDRRALDLIKNRGVSGDSLRGFLDRVAARMTDAGEANNAQEAVAYIVEQAVIESRDKGYQFANNKFLDWVDSNLGKQVGDMIRSFAKMVRQWMLRNGMPLGQITVDDLVEYAKAGVNRAAMGKVDGGQGFSRSGDQTQTPAFKRWFGDSKVVDSHGNPLVVYHGTDADFSVFNTDSVHDIDRRRMGAYFSANPKFAKAYGGDVVEAYLSIRNPLDIRGLDANSAIDSLPLDAAKKAELRSAFKGNDYSQYGLLESAPQIALRKALEDAGYDGIAYTEGYAGAFVVFHPEQIKSATGNNGQFDPSNPDIRFSRSGFKEYASKATAELNKTFNAPGKLSWWHKSIGTMYNLAERSPYFKPVFEAAQGFIDDVSHYVNDAADLAPKLLPKLESWSDILKSPVSAEDNKAVAKPIFEGTLSWARDEQGNPVKVADLEAQAANLSTEEKAAIMVANGKLPEGMARAWKGISPENYTKAVDSRYESQMMKPGIVWTDAELRSIHGLNDGQIALYREFRSAVDRSLDTMARADMLRFGGEDVKPLRDMVMDAADVQDAARILRDYYVEAAQLNPDRETQLMNMAHGMIERADRVAQLQGEGYAPLSRFGKYTVDVVGQDGNREYFGLYESAREANNAAEAFRKAFPDAAVSQGTLSEEAYKLFAGITPESLELFGNMLGLGSTGDSAQDQAFQEYLRLTKTNRSAMKRLIHRQGIAGYSEDVGRVLASFVYSNARQTAAGLNLGDLTESINKIPKEQGELKDASIGLAEYVKNPQEEAQAVRGLLFAQYLGGSIASAFVNMTQPFAVSFPWLSQYGGARKAASQLARAAKQMANPKTQYEDDLARALKAAEEEGTVSPQEVHQLMAQARGSGSLRSGDGTKAGEARAHAQNALSRLSVAWGKVFGAAEQVNRRMTYIAAYRMAKERGMNNPAEFAKKAVNETQFVYSKATKMRWGRGAVGGTLMTFKTYSVAYLELLHRMYTQGGPEGKKAALLALGVLMVSGGAGGLPFEDDILDLVDGLAQLMGYNFNGKKARQEFLEDVFGRDAAEIIDKGVSGLPGVPLDVSGRLGMGNLIPGTGLFKSKTDHTRDVLEIVGPAGDFAGRIASGTRKVMGGDIGGGLLEVSPTAVRNAAKGVEMAATGMYRDTKGYKVLDTNMLEAALKTIGFQPGSVAKVQEANFINQEQKNFYSQKAQEIRAHWAQGIFEKDQAKVQEARDMVADWNRKNPSQRMIIRIPDVMRRVREMNKTKDQRIADTAPKAMRAQMREDVARLRAEMQ